MSLLDRLFKLREQTDDAKPFLQHLEELRGMLVKMVTTLGICMAGSLYFQKTLVHLMEEPLARIDPTLVSKLQNLGVIDPITISFSLAFYAGIILSFPLLLLFVAQFVIPALTRKEQHVVFPAIAVGFGLFLTGVLLCYFVILPQTLKFCFDYSKSLNFAPSWTVREYFSFVTQMLVAFGAAFEMPVGIFALVYLEFISFDLLHRTRPYAYVLVLTLAAVLAPTPDPLSFAALGVPMCLLYEGCIWIAWLLEKRRKRDVPKDEDTPALLP